LFMACSWLVHCALESIGTPKLQPYPFMGCSLGLSSNDCTWQGMPHVYKNMLDFPNVDRFAVRQNFNKRAEK